MKNESSQSGWWGKGAALVVVLAIGGVAAAPYLIAATKTLAAGEKVSVEKVVKEAEGEMKKNKSEMDKHRESEVRTASWSADGKLYIGSKAGLAILKDGRSEPVADFPMDEAKSVACAADGTVWVAGKKGLHLLRDGNWSIEKSGDMHAVTIGQSGVVVAVSKKEGIFSRDLNGTWSTLMAAPPEMKKDGEYEKKEHAEKEHGKEHH